MFRVWPIAGKNYSSRHWFKRAIFSTALIAGFSLVLTDLSLAQETDPPKPRLLSETDSSPEIEKKKSEDASDQKDQEKEDLSEKQPELPKIVQKEDITHPPVMKDLSKLPFPVRRMRELILEAAVSGDIEKLRPLIGYGDDLTMLSLGGIEEDPIDFLKSLAGDDKGHEILAILAEVLEAGFVHMDKGTENELYVWPYFVAWPLETLTPEQRVELYRLVTHGDYEDMQSFGAYIFYRLGITPRGRWRFFVAGD